MNYSNYTMNKNLYELVYYRIVTGQVHLKYQFDKQSEGILYLDMDGEYIMQRPSELR